ncbi:MAG: hypothetical protein BWY57_03355 [Betaproteobacteria bacterium ADurb.Bin341]|nr:MAG: hypothetical protein BWY57_03355 [Betaproteobacteria bacterium ADurb.Bin341]
MGKRSPQKVATCAAIYVSERRALEIMASQERRNLTGMIGILIREGAAKRGVPVQDAPTELESA